MSWLKLKKHASPLVLVVFSLVSIAGFVAALYAQPVSAGGGVGSGGSATGGTGGYQSTDGYGWYLYSVSGGGPNDGFRDGTSWSTVQATCSGFSSQVAVFVIRSSDHTKYKAYNYPGWNNSTYYLTGGNFISVADAKAGFDALDSTLKIGFAWTVNVAWYCYGTLPPPIVWTMTGWTNASAPSAHPGQSFTFSHHVKNNGPNTTTQDIWSDTQVSGGGTAKSGTNFGKFTPSQDTTTFTDTTSFPDAASTKNGNQICERVGYQPASNTNGAYTNGAWACVTAVVDWTIGGAVTPHNIAGAPISTAQPNTRVYFDYQVQKSGVDKAYGVTWVADPGGLNATATQTFTATTNVLTGNTSYIDIPITAKNGDTFCKSLTWTPKSSTDGSLGTATGCVTVSFPYTLTPTVTSSTGSIASVGETITFTYNVNNPTIYTTNSFTWNTSGNNAGATITPYSGTNPGMGGSSNFSPSIPVDTVVANFPVGSQICRTLTINPAVFPAGTPATANVCVLIAASPYVTMVGGNVWAGGSTTSPYTGIAKVTASPPSTFGSFGDYGVFATGVISYFGSAGQFGKAPSTSGMVDGTRLTFANAPNLGSYSSSHKITNMMSSIPVGAPIGNGPVPATGVYVETSSNITLSATNMAPGTHVTIYVPNNTVRIDGNITYDTTSTSVSSFAQVPSLTIVAKRIEISGTVAEIAGNFYASESFVTCYQGPENTGENILKSAAITSAPGAACNNRLDIHGAVTVANQAANSLVFNRSSGGGSDGNPSEVIQMRPEVFLTAYEMSAQSGDMIMTTVQETSLPPRY